MNREKLAPLPLRLIPLIAVSTALSCAEPQPLAAPSAVSPATSDPTHPAPAAPFRAKTKVSIREGLWRINGEETYPGAPAEGLLLNVRMVNATFEDRNPKTCPEGLDPEANTSAFLAELDDYAAHGVRAFTFCLQGGSPGYEGAINSAYAPDGALREEYAQRVARVIEACDRAGVVVILGCFYQRQDQVLRDEEAVKRAVEETGAWIVRRGYTNVVLEIANEHAHSGFDHEIIRDPLRVRELIAIAHRAAPGLLVSTSGLGKGRVAHSITTAADFVLLHFNTVPVDTILNRVAAADKVSKAIVCNEDDKTGEEGARSLQTTVDALCSWGYMNAKQNQYWPFRFEGAADDPVVYAKFKELATRTR